MDTPEQPTATILGKVVMRPLASVTNNPWNPNRMTDHLFRSVVHGLKTDGWVASQALLVWGVDDKGVARNVIIDGEHRWRAAQEAGFTKGPMVVLDGLSEHEAKEYTIKLNQKRGDWDATALGELIRELAVDGATDMALDLGIEESELDKLIASASAPAPATEEPAPTGAPPRQVEAPAEFQDLTAEGAVKTDFKCPRCAYCWSGAPK